MEAKIGARSSGERVVSGETKDRDVPILKYQQIIIIITANILGGHSQLLHYAASSYP